MAHCPRLDDPRPPHELLPIVDDVIQHIEAGKSFGFLTKLTNPDWMQLISVTRIGIRSPMLDDPTHFRAVRALLRTKLVRQELVERWERQIATRGGPAAAELGERPELVCRQFVPQMQACLEWHRSMWLSLEVEFRQLGFGWSAYLQLTPPQTGDNAELSRLRDAVLGDLERILKARAGWLRLQHLEQVWSKWRALIPEADQADAAVTYRLRQAIHEAASTSYQESYEELIRLKTLEPDLTVRRNLLERLEQSAPAWASAIQNRHPSHSSPEPPGESMSAWEWRQMYDELERWANVSLEEIQQRIEHLSRELLDVTSQLVEKLTWVSLIRKVNSVPGQKFALGEYAAARKKQTKTGRAFRMPNCEQQHVEQWQ